ncbi:MAG TPA: hypothetical protein VGD72_13430 [Mycobacteriales bacterium]|jgi:hypothetical protein
MTLVDGGSGATAVPVAARPGLPGATAASWHDAWATALDALELDLGRADAMLAADHTVRDAALTAVLAGASWTPPADLPPLPAALAERARHVLERQLATAALLATAATATRRQSVVAGRLGATEAARPVFLDHAV